MLEAHLGLQKEPETDSILQLIWQRTYGMFDYNLLQDLLRTFNSWDGELFMRLPIDFCLLMPVFWQIIGPFSNRKKITQEPLRLIFRYSFYLPKGADLKKAIYSKAPFIKYDDHYGTEKVWQ